MSYKKALKKLEALPPSERQLAAGQYVWQVKKGKSHCGCAIGKLLTEKQRVRLFKSETNAGGVDDLRCSFLRIADEDEYIDPMDGSGILDLTLSEANRLQSENDFFNFGSHTDRNAIANRKARYKYVVAWLKEQIAAAESVAAVTP